MFVSLSLALIFARPTRLLSYLDQIAICLGRRKLACLHGAYELGVESTVINICLTRCYMQTEPRAPFPPNHFICKASQPPTPLNSTN